MSFSRSRSLSHSRGLTSSRSHSLRVCWREMARTSKSKMLVQVGYPPQCHLDYNVFVQFPIIFAKLSRLCVLTDGPEASNDRSRPWDLWSFSSSPSGTSQELSTKECEKEEEEQEEEQEEEKTSHATQVLGRPNNAAAPMNAGASGRVHSDQWCGSQHEVPDIDPAQSFRRKIGVHRSTTRKRHLPISEMGEVHTRHSAAQHSAATTHAQRHTTNTAHKHHSTAQHITQKTAHRMRSKGAPLRFVPRSTSRKRCRSPTSCRPPPAARCCALTGLVGSSAACAHPQLGGMRDYRCASVCRDKRKRPE